jgi:para-nitrobenzyl esterase
MLRIIKTENGIVQGIPAADPRITAFKGIPFAAPPTGANRWRAPQPAANWSGIRQCFQFAPIAMQDTPGEDPNTLYSKEWHVDPTIPMSEDCLYLNVWTPAKTGQEKLPVMMWIFGGGLQGGYPGEMEFDGERIARRGVVLVSVCYRCNVFGFLAHPEITTEDPDGVHCNWGFLDQKAGIDWIRRNIAAFGGDPQNITIFGQSGGGRSVLCHMTSPIAEGSFQRAIAQSCGAARVLAPKGQERFYVDLKQAEMTGKKFFEFIGALNLAEARAFDAKTLFVQQTEFNKVYSSGVLGNFGLTIDGKYVAQDPTDVFLAGRQHKIPYIVGLTTDEFHCGPASDEETAIAEWAANNFGGSAATFLSLARQKASRTGCSLREAATVSAFDISVRTFCQLCVERGDQDVYFYHFGPEMPGDSAGAFHSSDLWFEFETLAKCWRPFKGKHFDLARQMCNYWTNFARTGNPNGPDADGTPMPEWRPYSAAPRAMEFLDAAGVEPADPDDLTRFLIDNNRQLLRK